MYLSTFFLLLWFAFSTKIQACSFDCGELDACISPAGVEADCTGFVGCHEKCPPGSIELDKPGNKIDFSNGSIHPIYQFNPLNAIIFFLLK